MKNTKLSLILASLLALSTSSFADDKSDIAELKQQVKELQEMAQTLTDETSDLKTGFNYTTVDPEKSYSGLGAAASKVYFSKSPLSIGGYGEMYASDGGNGKSIVDVYRFVPYIGYKFTDNIILNVELEFEHGGSQITSLNVEKDSDGFVTDASLSQKGEYAKVEFMYLDFLINKSFNLRLGNMLVPMGIINERHEPTLFTTVQRPGTSKYLIPSTWHESGIMAYGNIVDGLVYKFFVQTALKPKDSGTKWIRNGRGAAYKNKDIKPGVTARIDYTGLDGLNTGVSVYNDEQLLMYDAHIDYKVSGARVYGVYTATTRSDATAGQVDSANGGYLNASFDVLSLTSMEQALPLFVQYETITPEASTVGEVDGDSIDTITIGANFFPHPQVVLKADYAMVTEKGEPDNNIASISMGFIF
ncbi:MAG TPA: porin [Sulfurimonas sp.]|nr:porin [Sulfurimonas sp.]HIM75807.1 porin [Campylobacterales bacterium]